MQYQLTVEQEQFKAEVEEFLAAKLPEDIASKVRCGMGVSKAELGAWTKGLNAQGWAAPNWPVADGVTG